MHHFTLLLLVLFISLIPLNAAEQYDGKALRTITKLCTSCHGTSFYMAKQKDEDEWEEFFEENDKKLLEVHKGSAKGLEHIQNKRFKYYREKILKFFKNNSKYSGKVHGCDANFCGTHH